MSSEMRNSKLHKTVAPATIKRIHRDLKEIEENPLPGISVCMPDPNDLLTLQGNILIMDGPYRDMLIHIIVHLPHDYPIVGPAVNIAPGLSFGNRFHSHIDDDYRNGNQICTDLLTNVDFMYEGGMRQKSGWTPSYTLSTVLLHLQVFFADPDRPFLPDQKQIESLRRHIQDFKMLIALPDGKIAVHSFENPYPPLPLKIPRSDQIFANKSDAMAAEEEKEKKTDFCQEAEQWLYCAISKRSIFDESKPVLGYPLDIRKDRNKRYWPKPVLEMVSYESFMQIIGNDSKKFEFRENVRFKSSFGEPYNFWIPVYINEEHYQRCHERICKAMTEICKRCDGKSRTDFKPIMVLVVLPVILNKMIVGILKQELHHSVAVIQAYWHFYRLLLRLLDEFPELKDLITKMVGERMKGDISLEKDKVSRMSVVEATNLVLTNISIAEVDARNSLLPKPFVEESLKKLDWIQKNVSDGENWDKIHEILHLGKQINTEGELINLLIKTFDISARKSKHKSKRYRRSRSRSTSKSVSRSGSRRRHSRNHRRRRSSRRSTHRSRSRGHGARRDRSRSLSFTKKLKRKCPKTVIRCALSLALLVMCVHLLDEEERKLIDEYKGELTKKLVGTMQEHLEKLSKADQYVTADFTMKTRTKPPGKDYFEFLWRRKSIRDLAFDNKKVLVRIHLKQKDLALLKKETKVEAPVVEEEKKEDPKAKGGKDAGKDTKKDVKQVAAQQPKGRTAAAGRKGKKEEEKAAEEAEKKIDPITLIDEKSLEDALKIIKFSLDMLAKLVVVVVSYGDSFGQPKEGNSARVLYDWLAGKLDQPVIFLDSAKHERDADDNFIFDSYGDNTVVILENLFFYPEEAGYQFDPKTEILQKADPAGIEEYAQMLSQYCNFYVIDDKYNFFKNYNSITDVKTEQNVLGLTMGDDTLILAQTFLHAMYRPQPSKRERRRMKKLGQVISKEHKLAIALIGGDLTGDYILALDTIVEHYDVLYFLGRVGVLVYMLFAKIEKIGDIVLDPFKKALLEKVLNRCNELGKRIEFPKRFELAERPNPELPEAAQIEKILRTRICYPLKAIDPRERELELERQAAELAAKEEKKEEEKKGGKQDAKGDKKDDKKPRQPSASTKKETKKTGKEPEKLAQEDSPDVGFNEKWIVTEIEELKKFETDLMYSRNVLWLGNLSPFKHPELNTSTKYYANQLYEKHQDRTKQELNGIPNDDFLSTIIGKDLAETLNYFQFEQELAKLEKKKKKRSRKSEDGGEGEDEEGGEEEELPNEPEEGEGEDGQDDEEEDENGERKKKKKLDNIDLITSVYINLRFFSTNEEFLVKLLSGKYCKALDNIDSWPKRSDSDDDGVDLGDDV